MKKLIKFAAYSNLVGYFLIIWTDRLYNIFGIEDWQDTAMALTILHLALAIIIHQLFAKSSVGERTEDSLTHSRNDSIEGFEAESMVDFSEANRINAEHYVANLGRAMIALLAGVPAALVWGLGWLFS